LSKCNRSTVIEGRTWSIWIVDQHKWWLHSVQAGEY